MIICLKRIVGNDLNGMLGKYLPDNSVTATLPGFALSLIAAISSEVTSSPLISSAEQATSQHSQSIKVWSSLEQAVSLLLLWTMASTIKQLNTDFIASYNSSTQLAPHKRSVTTWIARLWRTSPLCSAICMKRMRITYSDTKCSQIECLIKLIAKKIE